jgi:hypothetical protein
MDINSSNNFTKNGLPILEDYEPNLLAFLADKIIEAPIR